MSPNHDNTWAATSHPSTARAGAGRTNNVPITRNGISNGARAHGSNAPSDAASTTISNDAAPASHKAIRARGAIVIGCAIPEMVSMVVKVLAGRDWFRRLPANDCGVSRRCCRC